MLRGEIHMAPVSDRTPSRQCWMLFKVANLDRLEALQNGLLYMNSADYFSNLEGEECGGLRKDGLENVYFKLNSGRKGGLVRELALQINGEETILGPESEMTVHLPKPSTVMVYCFGSIAEGPEGFIPGVENGELSLSKRFAEFGTHLLHITNPPEFSKRLSKAIADHPLLYNSPFLEGGYGQVDYLDLNDYSGAIGLFRKHMDYSWQREYRICLGVEPEGLNDRGALELRIGDLSDISKIYPVDQFVSAPITIIPRSYRIVDGKPVQI